MKFQGHYIGTLGQTTRWDIDDPDTFAHPRVPRDVLSGWSLLGFRQYIDSNSMQSRKKLGRIFVTCAMLSEN